MYRISDEGILLLTYQPTLPEGKIRSNIEEGHKSEIFISYRIQNDSGNIPLLGGVYREVDIRRTGFRDQITGDYVLMQNGREIAVYREWTPFMKKFSSPIEYTSRIQPDDHQNLQIRLRSRVIYKKLVPPFSLLYLIPGKFMHRHPWQSAEKGEGA